MKLQMTVTWMEKEKLLKSYRAFWISSEYLKKVFWIKFFEVGLPLQKTKYILLFDFS